MPRPRKIEEAPLPNWPILMGTPMAARYLSLDENSFALVTQRAGVRPVDLGLAMVRWRRPELDRLVGSLASSSVILVEERPTIERDSTEIIARRVAEEVVRRTILSEDQLPSETAVEAMSLNDAAKAIGVGRSTLYKLIGAGRLPTRRIGGRVLVRRSDLKALLELPDPEHEGRGRRRGR